MSMMGDKLMPCACEVDIAGVVAMYALVLASGNAAALIDWNNNYGDDRNKCVAQHCSNYPRSFVGREIEVSTPERAWATRWARNAASARIKGKVAAGPMTYLRFSTDDVNGRIRGYVGDGEFTDDPFNMSGWYRRLPGSRTCRSC